MFAGSSHQSLQPWSEKNLVAEGTGMIWRSELDTDKLWAKSNSHQHGGIYDTSCPCALCPLGELAEEKEKEMPQCCHKITCTGHAATLAETGYQPDMLLAGKSKAAGQRGTEKCETKLPGHCQGTWMTARKIPGLYPDMRPGTNSSGTFVSWTIPLLFPSMLCCTHFKLPFFLNKCGAQKGESQPTLQPGY